VAFLYWTRGSSTLELVLFLFGTNAKSEWNMQLHIPLTFYNRSKPYQQMFQGFSASFPVKNYYDTQISVAMEQVMN